ncbi:MAG: hypothetical protein IT305_23715 [Chloroflexi bacterium]|nr:hypothetical protein [Chloroflexota bacterium]
MTVNERRKSLKRMQARRLSGPSLGRQPRRQQGGREYGAAVDDTLRGIWEGVDYVCAERLRPALVVTAIPMRRIRWDMADPGHFEVDLVHHSGPRSDGEFVHTFQMIDVATGWSEREANLGRGQRAMEVGARQILARLPFPVTELHPDNGSEWS